MTLRVFRSLNGALSTIDDDSFDIGEAFHKFLYTSYFAFRQGNFLLQRSFQDGQEAMGPFMGLGAIKVEQYTGQIEGRVALTVEQNGI